MIKVILFCPEWKLPGRKTLYHNILENKRYSHKYCHCWCPFGLMFISITQLLRRLCSYDIFLGLKPGSLQTCSLGLSPSQEVRVYLFSYSMSTNPWEPPPCFIRSLNVECVSAETVGVNKLTLCIKLNFVQSFPLSSLCYIETKNMGGNDQLSVNFQCV